MPPFLSLDEVLYVILVYECILYHVSFVHCYQLGLLYSVSEC